MTIDKEEFAARIKLARQGGSELSLIPKSQDITTVEKITIENPLTTSTLVINEVNEVEPKKDYKEGINEHDLLEQLTKENEEIRARLQEKDNIIALMKERSDEKNTNTQKKKLFSKDWGYFAQLLDMSDGDTPIIAEIGSFQKKIYLPLGAVAHFFDNASILLLTRTVSRLEKKYKETFLFRDVPKEVLYMSPFVTEVKTRKYSVVAKFPRGQYISIQWLLRLLEHFAKKNVTDNEQERVPLRYNGSDENTKSNRARLKAITAKKSPISNHK